MNRPIISSLLDLDFYKLTMAQVAWERFRRVRVKYAFTNRTTKVRLADVVSETDLRGELKHIRTLRFHSDEIEYLRQMGIFSGSFLCFLRRLRLPAFKLWKEDGQYRIEVRGRWPEAIFWETLILSVVGELYYRQVVGEDVKSTMMAWVRGYERLAQKIALLKELAPDAKIIEFGTRRRFSRNWQQQALRIFVEKAPEMLVGTSNVALARRFGLKPIGTFAHEMFMAFSGIFHGSDDEIRASHNKVLQCWWSAYGEPLSIALTDTYTWKFFRRDMTAEQARLWRGLRQDSGDPFAFGEEAVEFYKGHGVDPATKLVVFSDGLVVRKIIALQDQFRGRIKTAFGWGTDLTNDCGFAPLSLVMKVVESCGHPTVKLSDNPAKATGPASEVARYIRIFDAVEGAREECRF